MDPKTLARAAAECLSGKTRAGNVRRLSKLLRGRWSKWESVWAAAVGGTAPLVCGLNMSGQTAENDHHPIAAKLLAWAQTEG